MKSVDLSVEQELTALETGALEGTGIDVGDVPTALAFAPVLSLPAVGLRSAQGRVPVERFGAGVEVHAPFDLDLF